MVDTRGRDVDRLLEAALELPSEARAVFLASACSDEAVRDEVLSLARCHDKAGSFLEQPALRVDADRPRFDAGQIVADRFRVECLLERGGQGEVYKAFDRVLNEWVALKTVLPVVAGSARARRRLEQEIRLARRVSHPNVCRVHDVFHHEESNGEIVTFLSMELLDGETLARRRRRDGPLPWPNAVELMRQVAAGLRAAHDEGIIHGDLKPSNIMLVADGDATRAVITDFGLATREEKVGKIEDAPAPPSSGPHGPTWGTPGYMAPEQLVGEYGSVFSDIYALGLIAYEVLTGTKYADDSTALAGIDTPRRLDAWIGKCLETNPTNRPRSASDCEATLAVIQAWPDRRRRLFRLATAVMTVGTLVGAAWVYETVRPKTIDWTAGTNSVEAAEEMEKGLQKLRDAENIAAIPHLRRAVELDGEYLLARAKLAEALVNVGARTKVEALLGSPSEFSEGHVFNLGRTLARAVSARSSFEPQAATALYRQLARNFPDDTDMAVGVGRALEDAGQLDEAVVFYQEWRDRDTNNTALLLGLARVLTVQGGDEGLPVLRSVEGRLPHSHGEAVGMLHAIRGVMLRKLRDFEGARRHLEQSLERRDGAGDSRGVVGALTNLAQVDEMEGDFTSAISTLEHAIEISRREEDEDYESFALVNLAYAQFRRGALDEALVALGDSMEIEYRRGDVAELADRLVVLAQVNAALGRYEEAVALLREAEDQAGLAGWVDVRAHSSELLGSVRRRQGRLDEALAAIRKSLALYNANGMRAARPQPYLELLDIHAARGDFAAAESLIQTDVERATRSPDHTTAVRAANRLASYRIRLGDFEAAARVAESISSRVAMADRGAALEFLLVRAQLERVLGDPSIAGVELTRVLGEARDSGYFDVRTRAQIELAELRLGELDIANARNLLIEAEQAARRKRARPLHALALLGLAKLALLEGDAVEAETHASAAGELALQIPNPVLRSVACSIEGVAHERQGEPAAARRAFADAARSAAVAKSEAQKERRATLGDRIRRASAVDFSQVGTVGR